jgi:hypothetical protein
LDAAWSGERKTVRLLAAPQYRRDVAPQEKNLQAFAGRSSTATQRIRKRFIQVARRWRVPISSVENAVAADSNHPNLDPGV